MSRRLRLPVSILATTALLGGAIAVAAPASADSSDVDTTLCPGTPVWVGGFDDSDAGQPVHGLTTVKGTTPTEFQGEFVSRIDDSFGNDIFLFKLSGSRITHPDGSIDAGIWAGISGSPVYDADNNLIGSVSYGFTGYSGSDIAGVTPAANVLSTERTDDPEAAAARVTVPQSARKAIAASGSTSGPTLRQLAPVRVSVGTTAGAEHDHFTGKARSLAERSTNFGSAGSAAGVDSMVAGGNIATSWSTGSVLFASVGSITAVCGNKIFAFGHPDENIGESHQTMHSASTLNINADGPGSYKMANINPEPSGALVEDGNNGVFGVLGLDPEQSIPVTTSASYGTKTQNHASSVSEPAALSTVVANQVYGEVSAVLGSNGSESANVSWTVTYRREGSTTDEIYTRSRFITSQGSFPAFSIEGPAGDVDALQHGSDEDITITSVDVTAQVTSRYYQAVKVAGVNVRTGDVYKPVAPGARIKAKKGSTLRFQASLKPVSGSKAVARVVPMSFSTSKSYGPTGRLIISGDTARNVYSGDDEYYSDEPPAELTFDDVLAILGSQPRLDQVTARMGYYLGGGRFRKTVKPVANVAVVGTQTTLISFTK